MKCPLILAPLAIGCVLAVAQEQGTYAPASTDTHTTTYQTAQGPLVVNWGQPAMRQYGPPPPFAQLDRSGSGFIGSDDAAGFPPLANDFIHADGNRDGRISSAEYARWASHN